MTHLAEVDVSGVRRICAELAALGVSKEALDLIYKAAMEAEIEQTRTNAEDWP